MIGEINPPSSRLRPTGQLAVRVRIVDMTQSHDAVVASQKILQASGVRSFQVPAWERNLDGSVDMYLTGYTGYWEPEV